VSWRIWGLCLEWLGFSLVLHCDAQMHFKMFKLIGIVSEIWNHRNNVVFKNGRVDLVEVFTMVQRKIWSWVTVKERLVDFSYSYWCLEPLYCMSYMRV
ncbi:hypothetical protein PHAVU_004G108700, partial [Phaseolus vulgaris]